MMMILRQGCVALKIFFRRAHLNDGKRGFATVAGIAGLTACLDGRGVLRSDLATAALEWLGLVFPGEKNSRHLAR